MRRHLGMTTAEVDALSWWERRMYIDGINHEFSPPDEDGSDDEMVTVYDPDDPNTSVTTDLSAYGITPITT